MKLSNRVVKTTLIVGALFTGSVSANELTVSDVVTHLVQQAVTEVSYNIANDVYASILKTSYHFELDESPIKTEVLISKTTEIVTEVTEKAE